MRAGHSKGMTKPMATLGRLLLAAWLSVACAQAWAQADAGKQRVIETLQSYIALHQESLDGKLPGKAEVRMAMSLTQWREMEAREQQQRRALLRSVEAANAEQVPALLAASLLPCREGHCERGWVHRAEFTDLVVASGVVTWRLLMDRFANASSERQEDLLHLTLSMKPAQCPSAQLDQALGDAVFRLRTAAMRVYRNNCEATAFRERLSTQLAGERDPERLLYWLDELPHDSAEFRLELARLTQTARLPTELALRKFCESTTSAAPLPAAQLDIPFWVRVFDTQALRRDCLVERVFLKLEGSSALSQMRPIFSAAASTHYGFEATQGLYGTVTTGTGASAPWPAAPMLATFQRGLDRPTLLAWRNSPGTLLGERLLLTRWLNEDPATRLPATLSLVLEVRSSSDVLVSSTIQPVRLGQDFAFTLPSQVASFQEVRYAGRLVLDTDQLRYRIEGLSIGLKPAGAVFDATVPLAGSFDAQLNVQREKYRWRISLRAS